MPQASPVGGDEDMRIEGLEELEAALTGLEEGIRKQYLQRAVGQATELVRTDAVRRSPGSSGELRNHIFTAVESTGATTQGIVYTNTEYAPYVEFGTGPKGAANHEGTAPVNPSYTPEPWWIPEGDTDGAISKKEADMYHMPRSETENGEAFRYTEGQPAQPFMYPALKDNEEKCVAVIISALRKEIKRNL